MQTLKRTFECHFKPRKSAQMPLLITEYLINSLADIDICPVFCIYVHKHTRNAPGFREIVT